jgi:hypothetical protein
VSEKIVAPIDLTGVHVSYSEGARVRASLVSDNGISRLYAIDGELVQEEDGCRIEFDRWPKGRWTTYHEVADAEHVISLGVQDPNPWKGFQVGVKSYRTKNMLVIIPSLEVEK